MNKTVFSCLIILIFSTFAHAKFVVLQITERVKQSDLIIIGKLQEVFEVETDNLKISKGTLTIEKIIFGNFRNSNGQSLKSGEKVQVEWKNSKIFACQFGFPENVEEIWFLNVDEEGNLEPLSPDTTASLIDLAEVKRYLQKKGKENTSKVLNTLNDSVKKVSQLDLPKENSEGTIKDLCSIKAKQNEYHPFSAFLVVLGSISLYYLLYRSKFKIR